MGDKLIRFSFLTFLAIFPFFCFLSTVAFSQIIQIGTQTQTPCTYDWDCQKLDYFVKLDENKCIGKEYYYDGKTDPLLTLRPYLLLELVGKAYTSNIQVGYYVKHKCGTNKLCFVEKLDSYVEGKTYLGCKYGCLVTPTKKGEKVYSNLCVCLSGQEGKVYCDPSVGNDVYYTFLDWTCEKSRRIAGHCAIGTQCNIVSVAEDRWECKPIQATALNQSGTSNSNVTYTLLIPGDLTSKPISVAMIQNGQILAEKPISSISALEYINKYGPVDSSQAYAFAQQTGLTSSVASSNSGTATGTTSTTYASTGSYATSSTTSSNSSWLSKIAAFFGFGRKTTSTTSASATASTYNSTYSTSTYPSYSSASSTSYSTYSKYPRTYSAYSTASTTYTPTYSTTGYSYSAYSTYTNYSYPSSYSYNSSYTNYKPSYTYSSYSSYSYPTYTSTYSSYTAPSYSNYTYSYPNYSYSSYSNYSYLSYSNS